MNLTNYKILISSLPVRQQSFITKRSTWRKAEREIKWLGKFNDTVFADSEIFTLSRQDIFETKAIRQLIIKTIYWAYPRGMRGNHFVNILKEIDILEGKFLILQASTNLNSSHYAEFRDSLKKIKGISISTYSKLLYFLRISFNDNPCLILDQRLIDVFNNMTYEEYHLLTGITYANAGNKYLDYISQTNNISSGWKTKGENIEQFLFIFGNNLK